MNLRTVFDFDELNRIWDGTEKTAKDMEKILEGAYMLGVEYAYDVAKEQGYDEDSIDDLVDISLLNDSVYRKTDGKTFEDRLSERVPLSKADLKRLSDEKKVSKNELKTAKGKGVSGAPTQATRGRTTGKETSTAPVQTTRGRTKGEIKTLLESEYHRVFNDASSDTAKKIEKKLGKKGTKTWATMRDDRVRDTHEYLEGQTVSIDEKFYTFDGDSAYAPGGFSTAENNANCRCVLKFNFNIGK